MPHLQDFDISHPLGRLGPEGHAVGSGDVVFPRRTVGPALIKQHASRLGQVFVQLVGNAAGLLARLVDPTPAWYARLRQLDSGAVVADFVQLQKQEDFRR